MGKGSTENPFCLVNLLALPDGSHWIKSTQISVCCWAAKQEPFPGGCIGLHLLWTEQMVAKGVAEELEPGAFELGRKAFGLHAIIRRESEIQDMKTVS